MEHLTRTKAHRLHKQLWNWLAENPTKTKCAWPKWEKYRGICAYCFPCHVHLEEADDDDCNKSCILKWPGDNCLSRTDNDRNGLFCRWEKAKTLKAKTRLAKQIRDLPLRPLKRNRKPTGKKGAPK